MGAIKDVSILRDQSTGVSRGCAFVIYEELAHAEAAIAKLDKKIKLPGATSQIEVNPYPFL
jgi:RNA recognition motif-containing protein